MHIQVHVTTSKRSNKILSLLVLVFVYTVHVMMLFASVMCCLYYNTWYIYLNPVTSPFYLVVEVLTSGGADVVV